MEVLDELLVAGVLKEAGERYHFTHDLLRQTIHSELNAARRVGLHRRAGEALERLHSANPTPHMAELAHHFFHAASSVGARKAVDYARAAGDHALGQLAYEQGVHHYGLALTALELDSQANLLERCELLLSLGDAQRKSAELHDAMKTFQAAAAAARQIPRAHDAAAQDSKASVLLARAALGYEDALMPTGLPRRGLDDPSICLLDEALATQPDGDTAVRARLLAGLARALRFAGDQERAAALCQEAVSVARRVNDPGALLYALHAHWIASWRVEAIGERLSVATELHELAQKLGDTEVALEARMSRFRTLLELGDIPAASLEIEAYRRAADALGQPQYRSFALTWIAVMAAMRGDFREAECLNEEALATGHREQGRDGAMFFMVLDFTIRREQGRFEDLAELERSARELVDEFPHVAVVRVGLAYLQCDLGDLAGAQQQLDRLAKDDFRDIPRDWVWLPTLSLLAEVCAALKDLRRAELLYHMLLPFPERNVAGGSCPGVVAYHLGLLAGMLGQTDRAEDHYQMAVELNARMGARPALAHTFAAYAELLRARGAAVDATRARELLESALSIYEEIGAPHHAARVQNALGVASQATDRSRPAVLPDSLTEREAEVLCLVATGRSNREIAEELVLSVRTVERHITNIYRKINARGKADATAYAMTRGLVASGQR
jgi:DNA-binding CsgD family transcriptional regulator